MSEPMSPSQIQSIAQSTLGDFDGLDPQSRQTETERIRRFLSCLDAQGWEVSRRGDRTTFEMAQWAFLRIESNIAAATPRAVIILSLHGILLSGAILQGEHIVQRTAPHWRNAILFLLGTFFLSAASALWVVFSTVRPRIAKPSGKRSLVFFGSIARMDKSDFVREFEGADRSEFIRDLVEEVHALAGLAEWKHRMFVRAFWIVLYVELPLIALVGLFSSLR